MEAWRDAMYGLVMGLYNILFLNSVSVVVMPFVVLFLIIRFVRWAASTSRGGTWQDDSDTLSETYTGLTNRISYGRDYQRERRASTTERDLYRRRRE